MDVTEDKDTIITFESLKELVPLTDECETRGIDVFRLFMGSVDST